MHLPVKPPLNQGLLLPDVLDFNMKNNPDQPFYVFAEAENSIKVISHLEFGRAAHRVAHALRPNRSGTNGEVVGILAQTDTILYNVIIAGLIVADLVPFPISPRNTEATVAGFLIKNSCHRLIVNDVTLSLLVPGVKACLAEHQIHVQDMPSLTLIFPYFAHEVADHPFERYPDPTERRLASDTCLILHSSGSTGTPRSIAQTHLYWMQCMSSEFRDYIPRLTVGSMSLPAFHTAGVMSQLFSPTYGVVPTAVFPPTCSVTKTLPIIPSPESVLKHAMLTNSNMIFAIPSFIQAWLTVPNALEYLKSLEFLCYAGGPLPPTVGQYLVSAGVRLHTIYGGTEFGAPTCRAPTQGDENDWEYVRFYKHMNIRWVPQGDGTFECQFLACESHKPAVLNLPDVDGYATSDLFLPHPYKERLWKIIGRMDEVIVHTTGEKTVPGPIEAIIMSNPLIRGALIFGQSRNQTGVLIDLHKEPGMKSDDEGQLVLQRNKIWPSVEDANKVAPAFSRIFKEMILFTSDTKPLPRGIKGTVLRKAALDLYDAEIATLYKNIEMMITRERSRPEFWDMLSIERWIQEQLVEITSRDGFSSEVSLFDQGVDSLGATILHLRIINAMRSSGNPLLEAASPNVVPNLVFELPTIKEIAANITLNSLPLQGARACQGTDAVDALVDKYSRDLSPLSLDEIPVSSAQTTGIVVLLTGSTGQLGCQILERLLQDDRVHKVYALNGHGKIRTMTLLDCHKKRFQDIGIDLAILESRKLSLIDGDLTRHDLGIDKKLYIEILLSLDVLIHNAWPLDFNSPLSSYDSIIKSSRYLVDLVRASKNASDARFVFVSSVASAQSWDDARGPVPEAIVDNASYAIGGGYGEGKYVVERLLGSSGLNTTALRLGQVCGNKPNGSWPTTEWLPMLVKSSVKLGIIPDLAGTAAWLPGSSASNVIVDVALVPVSTRLPPVLNVVHPRPVDHKVIITGLVNGINDVLGLQLTVVSFEHWIATLEAYAEGTDVKMLPMIPAIKLTNFLRRYAELKPRIYSLDKIQSVSRSMDTTHLKQLTVDDAKAWLGYWSRIGYLT